MDANRLSVAADVDHLSLSGVVIEKLDILDPASSDLVISKIRTVPGFPKEGINYRDLMPIFADCTSLRLVLKALTETLPVPVDSFDYIAGLESRGFLLASPLAQSLNKGLICIRKAGKLPPPVVSETYDLEYGSAVIEIEKNLLPEGARVLVIDDLLATGGTAAAAARLLKKVGAQTVGFSFIVELIGLDGRAPLEDVPTTALLAVKA